MTALRAAAQAALEAARDLLADMPIPDGYYSASNEVIGLLDAALSEKCAADRTDAAPVPPMVHTPTLLTNEQIAQIRADCLFWSQAEECYVLNEVTFAHAIKRAQPTQPQGEPVAWMYEFDGMVHDDTNPPIFTLRKRRKPIDALTEIPLYTAPQPVAQPLTPLTDEQIESGASEAGYNVYKLTAFLEGARYAERAHGIGAAAQIGGGK
jgi:hypothetical protein